MINLHEFLDIMGAARRKCAEMDKIDGVPFAEAHSIRENIRTAMSAIEAGIRSQDFTACAEAWVMLDNLIGAKEELQ